MPAGAGLGNRGCRPRRHRPGHHVHHVHHVRPDDDDVDDELDDVDDEHDDEHDGTTRFHDELTELHDVDQRTLDDHDGPHPRQRDDDARHGGGRRLAPSAEEHRARRDGQACADDGRPSGGTSHR